MPPKTLGQQSKAASLQRLIHIEESTQETLRQLILLLVARVDCPDSGERAARLELRTLAYKGKREIHWE